jgi:hypothetical protein
LTTIMNFNNLLKKKILMVLGNCQIHLLLQLTNIYETSNPHFDYGVCTQLADNHGYSAGIIQFTTGTGSAMQVIQHYTSKWNPNEFTPLNGSLEVLWKTIKKTGELNGNVDTLPGFILFVFYMIGTFADGLTN